MRLLPLLLLGCATFEGLPQHDSTRRYPLACVETTEGARPSRLVREFDDRSRARLEVTYDADGAQVQRRAVTYGEGQVTTRVTRGVNTTVRVDTLDGKGRRVRSDQDGRVTTYEYADGRLSNVVEGQSTTEYRREFRDGVLVTETEVVDGEEWATRRYSIDADGNRVVETTREGLSDGPGLPTRRVEVREGDLLREVRTTVGGRFISRAEHDYDAHGNRARLRFIHTNRPTTETTYWYGCWDQQPR